MLQRTRHYSAGFTLVELLIVIVVISILAVITIVAYNGVQNRANNQRTISMVSQYQRALAAYASLNGSYPNIPGGSACLGIGYSDRNGDGKGDCGALDTLASDNETINQEIRTILSSLPTVNSMLFTTPWTHVSTVGASITQWDDFTVNGEVTPYFIAYGLAGKEQDCTLDGVVDVDGDYPHMKTPSDHPYTWSDESSTTCVIALPNTF